MREGSAPTILTSIFSDSISIPCLTSCLNYSIAPLWALADGLSLNFLLYTSNTTEWLHFHFSLSRIGEGNGNPLHCSCLENPRDRGAWWAAISGVAQRWTWLKRLSSSSSNKLSSWTEHSEFICEYTCHWVPDLRTLCARRSIIYSFLVPFNLFVYFF